MSGLALLLGVSLTATAGGDLSAVRGEVDAELALDLLRASSSQDPPGAGSPATLAGHEAGMRLRVHASELGRRLTLDVDYQGREPIDGDVENVALRELFRAELRYALIEDHLTVGIGRFIAPSLSFLPMDGVRFELRFGRLIVVPYGGRRAISTTLRNLGFDELLPAAGASAIYQTDWLVAELNGSYSEDRAVLLRGTADELNQSYGTASGFARAHLRLFDGQLRAGGQLALAQRADYVIGPRWSALAINVRAVDVVTGSAFAEWRPLDVLRISYQLHSQQAALVSGLVDSRGTLVPSVADQRFTDQGVRVKWRAFELGWVRADGRVRVRADRTELRGGLTLDLDALLRFEPVTLGVRGWLAHESVSWDDPTGRPDLDRTLWSAAAALSAGSFEAEGGVSFIERSATPISSRVFDPSAPGRASTPEDFAPFVLEAQRFVFARAFYGGETWFGGLDAELNLEDPSEQRVFVQLGARWGTQW